MQKLTGKSISGLALRLVGACAVLVGIATVSGEALAGIANTKHNLGSGTSTTKRNNTAANTQEICVFCHTPHGGNVNGAAPLWNKRVPASATYQVYNSGGVSSTLNSPVLGMDTAAFNAAGAGGVSFACLSCHDGTQALDNLLNAPGSGGFSTNGGGTNGLNYTWQASGGTLTVDANGLLTGAANLGTNLGNDHPIGIMYCGGGVNSTTPAASAANCADGDFRFTEVNNAIVSVGGANQTQWWVNTTVGAGTQREKTDMILFTRNFTTVGGPAQAPSVECATCHDVHAESPLFLRFPTGNANSQVCLACHVK